MSAYTTHPNRGRINRAIKPVFQKSFGHSTYSAMRHYQSTDNGKQRDRTTYHDNLYSGPLPLTRSTVGHIFILSE